MVLVYVVLGYVFIRIFGVAFYVYRNGYTITSTRFEFLPHDSTIQLCPELTTSIQSLVEQFNWRSLGEFDPSVDQPGMIRACAFSDPKRRSLFIITVPTNGGQEMRLQCNSFIAPEGKLYTAVGNPSYTADNPHQRYCWLTASTPPEQIVITHNQCVEIAANEGIRFKPIERSTALDFLYEEDQKQIYFQKTKGIVKILTPSTWKFTFKASLLTSTKLAIPFLNKSAAPDKCLNAFRALNKKAACPKPRGRSGWTSILGWPL